MIIRTDKSEKVIDVGSNDILHALYSTIIGNLEKYYSEIEDAVDFLNERKCSNNKALECARQFNLIRDYLSQIKPENAIYDINDLTRTAPWDGNLSPVITSCGNMYLTSDGKDLLFEIVSVLTYAYYFGVDVIIEE